MIRAWNTAHVDIKDDNTDQTSNAKIVTASSSKLLAINEETRFEGESDSSGDILGLKTDL